ncbi:sensor histidine kinase [Brevibacillus ginsengisoli]|uniref:sensor histidine kinase n=1 Tax=Brevibacillus ginsengisoli TaxID=363854 RepID=UPI003CE93D6B
MSSIKSKLVLRFSFIILLIVIVFELLFLTVVQQYYVAGAKNDLVNRAITSTAFFNKYIPTYHLKEKAKYILENIPPEETAKAQIIDWQGNVVLQSYGYSAGAKVLTEDVRKALDGQTGIWIGKEADSGERILAVSNPLKEMDTTIGVLRYSVSMENVYHTVYLITGISLGVGLIVVLVFIWISTLMSNRIVRPIKELTRVTAEMARGTLDLRVTKSSDDEIGTLADTFNYMTGELMRHEQLKNEFISSVSHELRTPLTSIKGWSETLLTGDLSDTEETSQGLQVIGKETNRLIGLVEELLDFSKFQRGVVQLELQVVDIRDILAEINQQFSYREQQTVQMKVEWEDDPLLVQGDENRLKQVFINILDNALKFTKQNPHGQILLSAQCQDGNVIIRCQDNGVGIPAEDLTRIATKFYKGSSKLSGSGLGLAISQEIIELHHGQLQIESNEGTTVTIVLPQAQL